MTEQEFVDELKNLNILLTDSQIEQFKKYYELLIIWNEKINLTTITEKEDVYLKHFYDSATISKIINLDEETTLCDVGTGAGFPGIVLKIIYPHLKITLIDSLNKRIIFLNNVITELKLSDIEALHYRVEEYGTNNREKFDVVTARAVAPLNTLLEYCIPLTKVNKHFIPMKANVLDEIDSSQKAFLRLDCEMVEKIEFYLPKENSVRTLIKIKKLKKTNKIYPRPFSKIKKYPL